MPQITLYNALTGASTVVDAGEGLRQKTWLEEVSQWLKEAVEPSVLKGLGLGRMVNFPSFLDGKGLSSNPIGQAPVIPTFNGVEITRVVHQTVTLATGDGSVVDFGAEALTVSDRAHANYFNTTTDPDDPVAPRGASAPAFLQTIADGGGDFALTATSGILTLRINGVLFTVTGLIDETSTEVVARLGSFGLPADVVDGASGTVVRIFAPGNGVTSTIEAVTVAGDAGSVLFTGAGASNQPNVVYRGTNGPLGVLDNLEATGGTKPQRRILPLSLSVTDGVRVLSDDGAGALDTVTDASAGTINYATGVIDLAYATAPGNGVALTAAYKVLKAMDLTQPVRIPANGTMEIALRIL